MPLLDIIRAVRAYSRDERFTLRANNEKLYKRLLEVFARTWDLGFTAFGGPPVHFQIIHERFVEGKGGKTKWIDEQTYQELFAVSQALPGPASTKMVFAIAQMHAGLIPAIFVFLLWSLPAATAMYALSLGVQRMPDQLPPIVYALLTGMNASTVGIIALAAVQLASRAITDNTTRILVIAGGCAGLCYNALWYFPMIIAIGGIVALVWDLWLQRKIGKMKASWRRRRLANDSAPADQEATAVDVVDSTPLGERANGQDGVQRRTPASSLRGRPQTDRNDLARSESQAPLTNLNQQNLQQADATPDTTTHGISIKVASCIIAFFLISFVIVMVLRGTLSKRPLIFDLFANMYLAGTIIFGGGPVVIPLLREYVVQPGWVSPRDFLIGLAIIQALPGPNFNFSVYLGALTLAPTKTATVVGAFLSFVGIFSPGLLILLGVQSIWRILRTKAWAASLLRGINATAVGLVFTAVYRLWEIGYLTPESTNGKSLALEPWWVVVAAVTYAENAWFGVPPALAIIIGAVLGIGWYGAVGR